VVRAVGIDVCEIARLERALAGAAGDRLLARVFTADERAYCEGRGAGRLESYAARFAAKEAVAKALGTGIGKAVPWGDVEVVCEAGRAPCLRLGPRAAVIAADRGVVRWHLSLSHAGGVAVAVVVAEGPLSATESDDGAAGG
jgi:holo-[acyl-carrier protein] synthase